ncbi:hypothetical protein TNCV_5059041 [Trichonephila clavipes]|nr:hypothetical protein TNCV_5059041 [Trichonephila clavipes]
MQQLREDVLRESKVLCANEEFGQQVRSKQIIWKDLIDELKIFGMSSRHHIDDFMRGRIIGKIEEGQKIAHVARVFDIVHGVVSRLWK